MNHSSLQPDGLWNINSTAKYLGMSVAFLRKAVRQKRIPFTRIGDKALRFSPQAIDAWVAANSSGSVSHDGPGR
ncbi:MAG: helix-turn-helix domain-containing protein [Terriglobales bacterium]